MTQAMKRIKVGDKVRHTFSKEQLGTIVAVRNNPNGYDTKVAFEDPIDGGIYTDWFKNDVLFFDSETKPDKGGE